MTSLDPVVERFAEVNGVRLHYRISGEGSPVVLLHGYTQTGHRASEAGGVGRPRCRGQRLGTLAHGRAPASVMPAITDFVG